MSDAIARNLIGNSCSPVVGFIGGIGWGYVVVPAAVIGLLFLLSWAPKKILLGLLAAGAGVAVWLAVAKFMPHRFGGGEKTTHAGRYFYQMPERPDRDARTEANP